MKKLYLIIGLAFIVGCGSPAIRQSDTPNPPPPGSTVDPYVPNPAYLETLTTVKETGLPYVSEAAAMLLAILSGYVSMRNRKLKRTAEVLTQNITVLAPTPEEVAKIKEAQETAGVREEVRNLL